MDAKKLKLIVKGEKKPTFGTDPNDPWSVRVGITEGETGMLHAYLKSRGINPEFVSKDTKISHAKSTEFHKWKQDHMFDDPINYVSTTAAEKMKKIRAQSEEVELEEMKTLKLTPVEMRQKALTRAKRLTSVVKHNGLHKEEVDKTDTITVDIPLMIRLLEYAREDAKTDMDLHKVTERLIEIRGKGMLTMDDYEYVATGKHKVKEEVENLDELAPSTLASYVLKTTSKDPKRAEPRKKAMSKLAKAMVKQPVDPKAPRYSTNIGEGFDDHEEIAKELIRRHGMNITKDHLKALENERDSRGALDHQAVMDKVRAMGAMTEAKKPTALERFRKAASEREKKHAEIEKQSKKKPDMKGAIDRLEKHFNKEEVEINEDNLDSIAKKHGMKFKRTTYGATMKHPKKGEISINRYGEWRHYPAGSNSSKAHGDSADKFSSLQKHLSTLKEEVEQIDEISKSTLASYKDKSSASMKNAQINRDAAEAGKNMSKGFADLHAKSDAIVKKRVKGLIGYMQRKQGMKPTSEDVFQDTQAATQTAFDMGTQADDREPVYSKKKEMSKSARMIKSLYKKHKMVKEEIYDHEKEDKSVATYGKKPKVDKQEVYDDDAQAAMILKGGKTLTGQTRDTLEIDPIMRKPNNNNNNQTDK